MQKFSVTIFTPYSVEPLHPRLVSYSMYLKRKGFDYQIIPFRPSRLMRIIDKLGGGFFAISCLFAHYRQIKMAKNSLIIVQDLKLIFLLPLAKCFGTKVIYEILDNNVELFWHEKTQSFSILRSMTWIKAFFSFLEKNAARYFADRAVVNSLALKDYLARANPEVVFYCNPKEPNMNEIVDSVDNADDRPIAMIYLGKISEEKGFFDMLDFVQRRQLRFFIFGSSSEPSINHVLTTHFNTSDPKLIHKQHLSSEQLCDQIKELSQKFRLVGFSLIRPVHFSYQTQEANKDMDYMSWGIPILGNKRGPTFLKIKQGCGALIDDQTGLEALLTQNDVYDEMQRTCLSLYHKNYSFKKFEKSFEGILCDLQLAKGVSTSIQDIYERSFFADSNREPNPFELQTLSFLQEHIRATQPQSLLDAGCGNGYFAKHFLKQGIQRVAGFDLFESIDTSDEQSCIEYQRGSIEDIPFGDSDFDCVFCLSVIYYSADPRRVLSEIYRVLRPGGYLVLTAHTVFSLFTLVRIIKRDLIASRDMGHLRGVYLKSAATYRRHLRSLGFEIEFCGGVDQSYIMSLVKRICSKIWPIESWTSAAVYPDLLKANRSKILDMWHSETSYHSVIIARKKL